MGNAVTYDRDCQPATARFQGVNDCNELEGKRVRKVLTVNFDPYLDFTYSFISTDIN